MKKSHAYSLEVWPLRKNGEPIFTCSEEAIFFSHLIYDKVEWIIYLTRRRKKAYFEIGVLRSQPTPNYQRMMDLAVRAQFFRECLEEVRRINDGKFELPGGE